MNEEINSLRREIQVTTDLLESVTTLARTRLENNRLLIKQRDTLLRLCEESHEALEGFYDGAPDSSTRHLGHLLNELKQATHERAAQ